MRYILYTLSFLALAGCMSIDPNVRERNSIAIAEYKKAEAERKAREAEVQLATIEALKQVGVSSGANDYTKIFSLTTIAGMAKPAVAPSAPAPAPVLEKDTSALAAMVEAGKFILGGASIWMQRDVAITQSNNTRRSNEAMWAAFSGLTDSPGEVTNITIGGNGVVDGGSIAETNLTGGDGSIVGGSGQLGDTITSDGTGNTINGGTGGGNTDNTADPVIVTPVIVSPVVLP